MTQTARRRATRGQRGLTLLEVLIALGIGVLVVSMTSGIVGRTAEARDELTRRTRLVADARAALWMLRDDLANHRPGTLRIDRAGVDAQPVVSFERDAPEPQRLVYRVRNGRLVRTASDRFRSAPRPRRAVVATGVRRLDVAALGDEGWRDVWSLAHPPRALTVTLDCAGAPRLTVAVVPLAGGAA